MKAKRQSKLRSARPDDIVVARVRSERGLATKIAAELGINPTTRKPYQRTTVWMWQRVPAEHVVKVSKFLRIARHRIRPDIYPAR